MIRTMTSWLGLPVQVAMAVAITALMVCWGSGLALGAEGKALEALEFDWDGDGKADRIVLTPESPGDTYNLQMTVHLSSRPGGSSAYTGDVARSDNLARIAGSVACKAGPKSAYVAVCETAGSPKFKVVVFVSTWLRGIETWSALAVRPGGTVEPVFEGIGEIGVITGRSASPMLIVLLPDEDFGASPGKYDECLRQGSSAKGQRPHGCPFLPMRVYAALMGKDGPRFTENTELSQKTTADMTGGRWKADGPKLYLYRRPGKAPMIDTVDKIRAALAEDFKEDASDPARKR